MPRKVPRGTLQRVTDCNGFTRAFQTYALNASDVQMDSKRANTIQTNTIQTNTVQTDASNASDVQVQVSCVRGGEGRARVVTVTSIGSTCLLKNTQMANVLDKLAESGKSGA